jgi:hypothetical protein
MAHSCVVFKNPTFGTIKRAPIGFSWTTFFFGFWPALFRSDWKWAAINFAVTVVVAIVTMGFGCIVTMVVFGIIYNKMYVKELIARGYTVDSMESQKTIEQLSAELEVLLPQSAKP